MVGKCENCGTPLPRDANAGRKYCTPACKMQFWRRRHGYTPLPHQRVRLPRNSVDDKGKVDPPPAPPDLPEDLLSLSQPEILALPTTPNIIAIIMKAKLDLDTAKRRIRELEADQQGKEVTVLDPADARDVARYLAGKKFTTNAP